MMLPTCGDLFRVAPTRVADGIIGIPNVDHPVVENARNRPHCAVMNEQILRSLRQRLRPCDVVALLQRSYASSGQGKLDRFKSARVLAAQKEHYRTLQRLVVGTNASLLLLGDGPELGARGQYCAAAGSLQGECEVSKAQTRVNLNHERLTYRELVREDKSGSTFYLPLSEFLCESDDEHGGNPRCGAYIPGTTTLLCEDTDHLTFEAALYLWPFLCAFMFDNGLLGQ